MFRLNKRVERAITRLVPFFSLVLVLAVMVTSCSLQDLANSVGAPTPTAVSVVPSPTPPPAVAQPKDGTPVASPTTPAKAAVATPTPDSAASARTTVATEVYRQNSASVVNITSLAIVRTTQGTATRPQGLGSGFILDDQGHIITNNHVVEGSQELTVTFSDGTTVPAQLLGRDPDNDLAVVKVDLNLDVDGRTISSMIKPVRLGDSGSLVVGEDVVAIGSPLGLQQTVTTGIVSALRAPGEEVAQGELLLLGGAVQTDAAINPGNSGGPLFNYIGEVIGVNTWGLSPSGGSIGLGFAIPINVVKRVAPQLIERGCVNHPLVGISAIPLAQISQAAKRQIGVSPTQRGLLVQETSAGSAEAGLRAGNRTVAFGGEQIRVGGDIIIAIDGQPTNTGGDLRAYVENNKAPGDVVTITYVRDGQTQEARVTLGTRDSDVPCR
jgi:S1-C subfamily serine protease